MTSCQWGHASPLSVCSSVLAASAYPKHRTARPRYHPRPNIASIVRPSPAFWRTQLTERAVSPPMRPSTRLEPTDWPTGDRVLPTRPVALPRPGRGLRLPTRSPPAGPATSPGRPRHALQHTGQRRKAGWCGERDWPVPGALRVRKEGQVLLQLPLLSHTPLSPGAVEVWPTKPLRARQIPGGALPSTAPMARAPPISPRVEGGSHAGGQCVCACPRLQGIATTGFA